MYWCYFSWTVPKESSSSWDVVCKNPPGSCDRSTCFQVFLERQTEEEYVLEMWSFPFYLPGTNQYLFIVENLSRNTALKSMAISEDIEVPMHKYETMKILLLSVDEVVIMWKIYRNNLLALC